MLYESAFDGPVRRQKSVFCVPDRFGASENPFWCLHKPSNGVPSCGKYEIWASGFGPQPLPLPSAARLAARAAAEAARREAAMEAAAREAARLEASLQEQETRERRDKERQAREAAKRVSDASLLTIPRAPPPAIVPGSRTTYLESPRARLDQERIRRNTAATCIQRHVRSRRGGCERACNAEDHTRAVAAGEPSGPIVPAWDDAYDLREQLGLPSPLKLPVPSVTAQGEEEWWDWYMKQKAEAYEAALEERATRLADTVIHAALQELEGSDDESRVGSPAPEVEPLPWQVKVKDDGVSIEQLCG